ncbi:condensation domain-containing protein, partial [Corallococcus sicarius]
HGEHAAGSEPFTLSADVSGQLIALGRREGVTPFILLLAAFQVLLARASGRDEALVAFAHAHRVRPELERMPGMFANLLVVRTPLSGNPDFREVLRRVRAGYLEAFEHQGLPHVELMRLLGARDSKAPPALPAGFSFAQVGEGTPGLPGLTLGPIPLELEMTVSDVSLSLVQGPDGFSGSFEYRAALFRRERMEALGRAFVELLERVVAEPEVRWDSLRGLAGTSTGRGVA